MSKELKDDNFISNNAKVTLYHASEDIVYTPQWNYKKPGKVKETRDVGEGFYTSFNDRKYPIYLYSQLGHIILNKYDLNTQGLKLLELKDDIKWLMITSFHRSSFSRQPKYHYIRDCIRNYVSEFDLVIGTISDDRFFSAVDAFIAGTSTDFVTIEIAQMLRFGIQYVSKSDKADRCFIFQGFEDVSQDEIIEQRALRDSHREDMADLVGRKRAELRPLDTGRLFIEILDEMGDDVNAWLRK